MTSRAHSYLAWLLGFFLIANVYLLPSIKEIRATDALGVILGLWLLWRFSTNGLSIVPFIMLFTFGLTPFLWGLIAWFDNDELTTALSERWMLAVPVGSALFIAARYPKQRASLAWGLWWGCVANVVVLLLQFYDLVQLTQNIGLAAKGSWLIANTDLDATARAPGMYGHANASSAIVSLVVPLSLYFYYTRKVGVWVIIVSLGVLIAGTELTLSRSPLLVSLATILVFTFANRDLKPSLRLVTLLTLAGLPTLYWTGPPGGWQRWLDSGKVETNSGERLATNAEALRISLEHPLGTGWQAGQEALRTAGSIATHNAFLQIAVMYGIVLAAALALLMLILALQPLIRSHTPYRLEAMLAFQLFGLFLWEEHLNNPSFIILVSWLVAASIAQISSGLRRRGPALSTPPKQRASEALQ